MFGYATRTWPEDAALCRVPAAQGEVSSFDYCTVPTAFKGLDFDRTMDVFFLYKKCTMMHMLQRIHMCSPVEAFYAVCVVLLTGI